MMRSRMPSARVETPIWLCHFLSASEIVTTPGHVFYARLNRVTALIGPHAVGGATVSVWDKVRGREQLHSILHETPYCSFACFLKLSGNAALDRQVLSSGSAPLARRTRYRHANLLSGAAIDSNRNMRCAAPGR